MNFVHIGAGAGDLDPCFNFKDGFSQYVKNNQYSDKNIYLVEANPKNIIKLKECWKDYKHTKIFNCAIVPDNYPDNEIRLYYSLDDGPYYQLMSFDQDFVKRHYPNSKIESFKIKALKINDFFEENFKDLIIESFSIDIEGLDYEVFMDIDLKKYEIKNFSIEYLHLNRVQKKNVINKFIENGYSYNGFGIDYNNLDWLFTKKKSNWNNMISKSLPFLRRTHYKRINKFLVNL